MKNSPNTLNAPKALNTFIAKSIIPLHISFAIFKMKGLLAIILLIVAALTTVHFDFQPEYPDFDSWKQLHQISYETEAEEFYRRTIFYANLKKIAEHNAKSGETYKMGVNQFTDFSEEEFRYRFLNLDFAQGLVEAEGSGQVKDVIVDWVKEGAVGPVKNQGSSPCGAVYSTLGGVEGLSKVTSGKLTIFSDQQLIDCAYDCAGSYASQVYDYYKKHSVCTTTEYPNTGKAGTCQNKTCAFKISGYTVVKTCDDLASSLMKQPVSVVVDAASWSSYASGVFSRCGTALNHMVLLVGMADEYWKCKNSWGTTWGEQGYIKLARGNTCGICSNGIYPIK